MTVDWRPSEALLTTQQDLPERLVAHMETLVLGGEGTS